MSENNTSYELEKNPFETENIGKLIMKFAIPCVISLVVNSLYNIVDQIFIGQGVGFLGNAATNMAFPLVTISMAFALLLGDGCAAYLSLKLGAGDRDSAARGVGNTLSMLGIAGLFFLIFGLVLMKPLLYLFGATEVVMPYAMSYTSVIIIGLPFVIMGTGLNSIIRADGSPKFAMVSMLVGAALNTILDPIFIFVFDMGVFGAAVATIIGQIATFCISFCYIKRFKNIQFTPELLKIKSSVAKTVMAFGASSFIIQMAITLVVIVMNNTLSYYGAMSVYGSEIPLSALGIVMKVNQILMSVLIGIAAGSQPIIGYNYGAGNYERVKKTYLISVSIATGCALIGFCMFIFFPQSIINVFGQEEALYNQFALKCFRIFLMMCALNGFQIVSSTFFQAIGKPVKAAALSLSRQILFLIPMLIVLPKIFGVEGALYSGPVADFAAFLLAAFFIAHEMRNLNTSISRTSQREV